MNDTNDCKPSANTPSTNKPPFIQRKVLGLLFMTITTEIISSLSVQKDTNIISGK